MNIADIIRRDLPAALKDLEDAVHNVAAANQKVNTAVTALSNDPAVKAAAGDLTDALSDYAAAYDDLKKAIGELG